MAIMLITINSSSRVKPLALPALIAGLGARGKAGETIKGTASKIAGEKAITGVRKLADLASDIGVIIFAALSAISTI
jgi:hypothetical protein